MMGREYFTVAAYLLDGSILCLECGETEGLPVENQLTEAEVYQDFSDDGLCCDRCSKEIIELNEEEQS